MLIWTYTIINYMCHPSAWFPHPCTWICVCNHASHAHMWTHMLMDTSAIWKYNFALFICKGDLFLSRLSTDREIIHSRGYIQLHSNLQLCMLSGEKILTHCVLLHFLPLNYTTVVPFSQGVDTINASISHVKDRIPAAGPQWLKTNVTAKLIKF